MLSYYPTAQEELANNGTFSNKTSDDYILRGYYRWLAVAR
jgi:hypothetical protein